MTILRRALLCLLPLGLFVGSVRAQTENGLQGRRITTEQIKVLEKALTKQTKGIIFIESLGFFSHQADPPPPPHPLPSQTLSASPQLEPLVVQVPLPSITSDTEFDEVKTFSVQLWNLLQKCGYEPVLPGGSRVMPPKGISIRVNFHKARPIADALRASLTASGIKDVRIEEDPKTEAYYSKYLPSFKALMEIDIGYP